MNCNSTGDLFVVRFQPLFTTNYPDSSIIMMSRFAVYALSFECTLGFFYNCELNILAGYQIRYKDNYSYEFASDNSYLDIKCGNRWDTICFFGYSTGVSLTYVDWYD